MNFYRTKLAPDLEGVSSPKRLAATKPNTSRKVTIGEDGFPITDIMPTGKIVKVPYGQIGFCKKYKKACSIDQDLPDPIKLTRKNAGILNQVNDSWNALIIPTSNIERTGELLDHWDRVSKKKDADHRGDCKIYALNKRDELIKHGYPAQDLLMTILELGNGERHAVLAVNTDHGTFILDNLNRDILPWDAAYPRNWYIKQASPDDPMKWVEVLINKNLREANLSGEYDAAKSTPPSSERRQGAGRTPPGPPAPPHP